MKREYPISIIYVLAVVAMFFWGIAFVWVTQAYDAGFRPLTVVFLRLVIASVILTIISYALENRETIHKKDYLFFFFLAFSEPFCYFMGESFGMLYVSPTLASIIIATVPLVTPIFAWMFLKEQVNLFEIIGLITSFLGVAILVVERSDAQNHLLGVLLMFVAVLGGTSYGIILKKLTAGYSALTITKYQTYIGMLLFLPLFYIFDYHNVTQAGFTLQDYRYILLLGALPSVISFTLLAMAVRRLGIVRTNVFSNLIPVFTGLMAFYTLKETFSNIKLIGMAIVIVGLCISQMNKLSRIRFGKGIRNEEKSCE